MLELLTMLFCHKSMNKKARAHLLISGLVQGVFFRENTRQRAENFGLKGFVRNLPNGKVEAVFEGEKEKVEKIIEWCKKGPPAAKVYNVEIKWEDFKEEFKNFEIRYGDNFC